MDASTAASGTARNKWSGLAVLIAGIAIIVGSLGSAAFDWLWVAILVGFLGMVYGMPGVHDYQAPADGALGKWGALLVRYGGAVLVLLGAIFLVWDAVGTPPDEGPTPVDVVWMIGFAVFVIGAVIFAIGIIKGKALPPASGVLMLVGLVAGIAIDMATGAFFETEPTTTQWGFYIGVPMFALGLAWAGYEVWKGSTRPETVASA
jgi:hypothetical protein